MPVLLNQKEPLSVPKNYTGDELKCYLEFDTSDDNLEHKDVSDYYREESDDEVEDKNVEVESFFFTDKVNKKQSKEK